MAAPHAQGSGWLGVRRGHKARPLEWLAEKFIFLVSLSAILMILLIFLFVMREAWPVFVGKVNSAAAVEQMTLEEMQRLSRPQLQKYLGLTDREFREMDAETIELLMEVRIEAMEEAKAKGENPDVNVNGAEWRYLLGPHQWQGYEKPEYIWQPVGDIHKYNIMPLLIGSLKVSLIALLVAVPFALAAAIYISQLAPNKVREIVKPVIELLAGIPSVVLGFFALIVMAGFLQSVFGYQTRLNALLAGLALSLAVIPVIFSIAEDALTSVPRSYTQAALALGASKWQAAWQIVLPAALPGVFAAMVLGFGRAIGETMIVLMTSTASVMDWSIFESARPITATIAAELAEAVFGGHHYRILFMLGALLFAVTFMLNLVGDLVIHRLKGRLEGKA